MELAFEQSGKAVVLGDRIVEWSKEYESSMLDAYELLNLAAVLTAFPWNNNEFVLEIGAYRGTTTVFMAKVLESLGNRSPILSIDPFERYQPSPLNPQGDYSAYVANVVKNHLDDICLPLAAFSGNAAPVVASNIGVLVIDGDHLYPAVSRDLSLYSPKIVEGGYVFIDDYGPAYPGVVEAVDEFFVNNPEFLIHAKSYFVIAERIVHPEKKLRRRRETKSSVASQKSPSSDHGGFYH
jgi:hypothetical protein